MSVDVSPAAKEMNVGNGTHSMEVRDVHKAFGASDFTSSSVSPCASSLTIEPPAWLIVQPSPSNETASTRSSSLTLT